MIGSQVARVRLEAEIRVAFATQMENAARNWAYWLNSSWWAGEGVSIHGLPDAAQLDYLPYALMRLLAISTDGEPPHGSLEQGLVLFLLTGVREGAMDRFLNVLSSRQGRVVGRVIEFLAEEGWRESMPWFDYDGIAAAWSAR